jgi:hypothetical protein
MVSELSTAYVARAVGIHRDTLLRWLREGRIAEPQRDLHGWRTFTQKDLTRIAAYARTSPEGQAAPARRVAPEIARLERADWSFSNSPTQYLTHSIHPYPARFIPQIPNSLIQELSSVGEVVADIFCGSGTTLVEAVLLRRHAVGVDANPLACLLTRAKTTRLSSADARGLLDTAERADSLANRIGAPGQAVLFAGTPFRSQAERPSAEALNFWFEPFVIEELAEVLSWCNALESEAARTLALAAFSAVVVNVSRQDSDTRYVRRAKGTKPGDALRRFARSLADAAAVAMQYSQIADPSLKVTVLEADVLSKPDLGRVDLVVCSPPYPNAYSYHLYHMTRMLWLGMDQRRFKLEEIGSHRKYSQKGPKRATVATFKTEMATVFEWLSDFVRPGRHACFVVGSSVQDGRPIDNADVLSDAAAANGFIEVARIGRALQDSRKSFNPAIGKIKTEEVLILQRVPAAVP